MRKIWTYLKKAVTCFDMAKKIGAMLVICTGILLGALNWAKEIIVADTVAELKAHTEAMAIELYAFNHLQRDKQTRELGALITGVMDRQDRDSLRTADITLQVAGIRNDLASIKTEMRADTLTPEDRRWAELFDLLKEQEMDRVNAELDRELEQLYQKNKHRVDEIIKGDRAQ